MEHYPSLYEDAKEIPEYISQALRDLADRATVVLYAPSSDPQLEEMAKKADRIFYLQGSERPRGKGSAAKLKLAESVTRPPWRHSDG